MIDWHYDGKGPYFRGLISVYSTGQGSLGVRSGGNVVSIDRTLQQLLWMGPYEKTQRQHGMSDPVSQDSFTFKVDVPLPGALTPAQHERFDWV